MVGRLSHHKHSGKLRPHSETSYAWLIFLVMLTGLITTLLGFPLQAADSKNPDGTGSFSVDAVVAGPRPNQPAIITSPRDGQSFTSNPQIISGTCPRGTLIKIFKNGVLAGSVLCAAGGTFSVPVDLLIGANSLTAFAFNTNDESGPSSAAVNVMLNIAGNGFGFSNELILQSSSYYRGVKPGQQVVWPIEIIGGLAPYALLFDWGDGTTDLVTRLGPGPLTMAHTYNKVGGYLGSYPLIIRATDQAGNNAYLQLTTIVNEPGAATAKVDGQGGSPSLSIGGFEIGGLTVIWPLLIVLLMLILSFWLGERREKKIISRHMAALR